MKKLIANIQNAITFVVVILLGLIFKSDKFRYLRLLIYIPLVTFMVAVNVILLNELGGNSVTATTFDSVSEKCLNNHTPIYCIEKYEYSQEGIARHYFSDIETERINYDSLASLSVADSLFSNKAEAVLIVERKSKRFILGGLRKQSQGDQMIVRLDHHDYLLSNFINERFTLINLGLSFDKVSSLSRMESSRSVKFSFFDIITVLSAILLFSTEVYLYTQKPKFGTPSSKRNTISYIFLYLSYIIFSITCGVIIPRAILNFENQEYSLIFTSVWGVVFAQSFSNIYLLIKNSNVVDFNLESVVEKYHSSLSVEKVKYNGLQGLGLSDLDLLFQIQAIEVSSILNTEGWKPITSSEFVKKYNIWGSVIHAVQNESIRVLFKEVESQYQQSCFIPPESLAKFHRLQQQGFIAIKKSEIQLLTPAREALALPRLWFVRDIPFYARKTLAEVEGMLSRGLGREAVIQCGRMLERFVGDKLTRLIPTTLTGQSAINGRPFLSPSELIDDKLFKTGDSFLFHCDLNEELQHGLSMIPTDVISNVLTTHNLQMSEFQGLSKANKRTLTALKIFLDEMPSKQRDDLFFKWRTRLQKRLSRMTLSEQLYVLGLVVSNLHLRSISNVMSSKFTSDFIDDRSTDAPIHEVSTVVRQLRNKYAHNRTGETKEVAIKDAYHMIWLTRVFISMCVEELNRVESLELI